MSSALPPVVLSVGGSVLSSDAGGAQYYSDLAALLKKLSAEFPLLVTTGGGRPAREYIDLGRQLGLTEIELDEVGIEVTRIHARLLAGRIGGPTPPEPPTSIGRAVQEIHRCPLVILGGTEPGHTTDGVAALLASRLRASRVVNATRYPGLFDHDPAQVPGAKRRDRVGWTEFRQLVATATDGSAGQQYVFDRLGADLLGAAGIPLLIVDGRDLPNLEAALRGRPFVGTTVA